MLGGKVQARKHPRKLMTRHGTNRMFVMALAGTRDENPMVNQQLVTQDVEALYKAGAGQFGTVSRPCCSRWTRPVETRMLLLTWLTG
jgi:hypothetical protein